jgi:hypothetical protein
LPGGTNGDGSPLGGWNDIRAAYCANFGQRDIDHVVVRDLNEEVIRKDRGANAAHEEREQRQGREAVRTRVVVLREAGIAAKQIGEIAGTTNAMLNEDGRPLVQDLRRTVRSAERSMAALDEALVEAKPGIRTFSTQTLPEIGQLVRDLRAMSESLNSVASKIDQQGAGALISGSKLPDYKGGKDGK